MLDNSIDFWIKLQYYDIAMSVFDKVDYNEIEPALIYMFSGKSCLLIL